MCGIALILYGVRINSSCSTAINTTQEISEDPHNVHPLAFSIDDLKAALRRRGPDSLGIKRVSLEPKNAELLICDVEQVELGSSCFNGNGGGNEFEALRNVAEMCFFGSVLQLRGIKPVVQPLVDVLGNVLVYNGEIFGGINMSSDSNDTEVLMQLLESCCCCHSHGNESGCSGTPIPVLLSSIKGPWALIYWQVSSSNEIVGLHPQNASRTLWFGRDALGRRSLVVHWPTFKDPRFLLSSVSPKSPASHTLDPGFEPEASDSNYWEELPCGVYSISIDGSKADGYLVGQIRRHEWMNTMLKELIEWERESIEPKHNDLNPSVNGTIELSAHAPAFTVLEALRKSIARRTTENTIFKARKEDAEHRDLVPVAVLFSGGLDSMILAAILHECLNAKYGIDLLNVSFEGEAAPDRITARAGVKELRRIAPLRKWRLVEIDAVLSDLTVEMKHVTSLINPAKTYMDLNIGTALWLAAGGDGWVYETNSDYEVEGGQRLRYKSKARILLVGSGADEQCAGYGRHRTKYRNSSWVGLHEEMKLDMQRIWKRNLGRDDRCIADNGKEARFPFLDEDVIRLLLDFPLWEIANLSQPSGTGDKKILREVARLLGLHEAAVQPKRAIQFGSRIAQESNRKNFGSNRAANQASAGSVVFHKSSR